MKRILNLTIVLSLLAGASLFSCADSESRSSLVGDATVIINLGLPPDNETASISIIDRVLRFFSSEAVAAPAPAVFSTISIRVTGDGIGSIAKDFPPTSIISMTVPGGCLRTFDVTALVGDTSAVIKFHGSSSANVPSGGTVSIPVLMSIQETNLVIPDYYNQRLVMMSAVNGLNTLTRNAAQIFGGARTLNPWDVDIDARGRIYFSNPSATASGGIYRMDNMDSTWAAGTCEQMVTVASGVYYIAIDRKRNFLYYIDEAGNNTLMRYNLATDSPQTLYSGILSLQPLRVCVDEDTGYLYVGYFSSGTTSFYAIRRFDPDTTSWLGSASVRTPLPFDMTVHEGYLYESYIGATRINQVSLEFLTTINFLTGAPAPLSDPFIGPTLFIALTNRKLFVLDDSAFFDPDDRVVSIDDIDGSGWETTETPGTFRFYYMC